MSVQRTALKKAHIAYDKAQYALKKERDRIFPAGTKVRCKLTGAIGTVTQGSLYVDQVFIDHNRHNGITFLEVVDAN